MVLGVVMGLLVLIQALTGLEEAPDAGESIRQEKGTFVLIRAGLILGGLLALRYFYLGAKGALSFFVPGHVPRGIGSSTQVLEEIFLRRAISNTYQRPSNIFQLLLHAVYPQSTFLTPPHRPLFRSLLWALLPLVASILLWIALEQDQWPLLLISLTALAGLIAAIVASTPRVPLVEVHEGREKLLEAGNPIDLFHHIEMAFENFRQQPWPNRELRQVKPEVGVHSTTNRFEAELQLETQPIPVAGSGSTARNGAVLSFSGALLAAVGLGLLLFNSNDLYWPGIVGGGMGMILGWRLLSVASGLHSTFRFQSLVFWLQFSGSYTTGSIGIGSGHQGTLKSQRDRIQSDINVRLWVTQLITESAMPECSQGSNDLVPLGHCADRALTSDRYVVEALVDSDCQQKLEILMRQLREYRDDSDVLPGVNINAKSVSQIVQANAQLTALSSAAKATGAAQGPALLSSSGVPMPGLPSPTKANPPAVSGPTPTGGNSAGTQGPTPPPRSTPPASNSGAPTGGRPSSSSASSSGSSSSTPASSLSITTVRCTHCNHPNSCRKGARGRMPCQKCSQLFSIPTESS